MEKPIEKQTPSPHQPRTSHHNIPPHSHTHGRCPLKGESFGWCPKQDGDCRSSCPALNTLANHGHIRRDGKRIELSDLTKAVSKVYGCSSFLSHALVYGGLFLLGQYRSISLEDISRHNLIEHNASLTKDDADDEEYAPDQVDSHLLDELLKDSESGTYLDSDDLSLARVRRESTCKNTIDHLHQEIARGEMALILNVFGASDSGSQERIPLNVAGTWFHDERLPGGWKPSQIVGVADLLQDISLIRSTMKRMKSHWDVFGKLATRLETSGDKPHLSLKGFKDLESAIDRDGSKVLDDVLTTSPSHLSTFDTIAPLSLGGAETSASVTSSITLVDEHNRKEISVQSSVKSGIPDSESYTVLHKIETFQHSVFTTVSSLYAHI